MPHDRYGIEVKVGDRVLIPAIVTMVTEGVDFCNCSVEFQEIMPGQSYKTTMSAINTKQVEKVETNA